MEGGHLIGGRLVEVGLYIIFDPTWFDLWFLNFLIILPPTWHEKEILDKSL